LLPGTTPLSHLPPHGGDRHHAVSAPRRGAAALWHFVERLPCVLKTCTILLA
jgi:hypothetical protein